MKYIILSSLLCAFLLLPTLSQAAYDAAADQTTVRSATLLAQAPLVAPIPGRALEPRAARSVTTDNGIQGYIIGIGYFINFSLIPLILGLALLVFLYNIARYFINNNNVDDREKARTTALYGVAAFVAIVSIWGAVNLLVGGFNIDREESICPDFLGNWCGDSGNFGSFERTPVSGGGSRGSTIGGGSTVGGSSGSPGAVRPDDSTDSIRSPLAELLFGTFVDQAAFTFKSGAPRAETNTVAIDATASCPLGFETLQLAADIETNQAAFALFKQNGVTTWRNITDLTSNTGVGYDADIVNDLTAGGAENLHIVHTHPKERTRAAGLIMDGHGPSSADYLEMCDSTAPSATYVTIDHAAVWVSTQPNDACPRRSDEEDDLIVIDALAAVSMIQATDREFEWSRMLQSDITPSRHVRDLEEFAATPFNDLSIREILELSDPFTTRARVDLNRTSVANLCSGF